MKSNKIVTTVKGEKISRKKTRYISGEYYKIGDNKIENSGDCYLIDNKYYRSDTGYIIYDHRVKEYKIYNQNDFIKNGVVGFDDNKNPIFGGFSLRPYNIDEIKVYINGKYYYALNDDIFKNSDYLEDLNDGMYYHRQFKNVINFIYPYYCDMEYKYHLPYDCRGILKERKQIFESIVEDKKINENILKYANNLKDLTFGLEFETIKGFIPERICKRLGLMALRDGSINGLEYVTLPMQGENGLQAILDSLEQLNKRTTYDDSCSLHLHIGNIPRTEKFILALFKLLCFVQDDIFELFPLYKKYNFGYKRKHYTKPFNINQTLLLMDNVITEENIKENFDILFQYVSMGIPYSNYNYNLDNVKSHPSDPDGTRKWQIRSRYASINLIPIIFGNKETVEFRIHTPTFDENKVINYIFICSSIINFAKKYQDKILTNPKFLKDINLNNIIYKLDLNGELIDHLSRYIADRRNFVYQKNKDSKIHFKEDEFIPQSNYIKWGKDSSNSKKKSWINEALVQMERNRIIRNNINRDALINDIDIVAPQFNEEEQQPILEEVDENDVFF